MRLFASLLFCGLVVAQKKDDKIWFFGQKYESKKLKMLSTTPNQVIEQIFDPDNAAVKPGSIWHVQTKFKKYWKEIMDDIDATFKRCGIDSDNFRGLPINIRPNDHSVFAVRQHIWWLRDQFVGEIKEEILASADCGHADKKNAWRLIDTIHTKVQNLGYHYCKKQNPDAVECTPGKQRTWFGFENKRTLSNRLEKFAQGEAKRRVGIRRSKRDT
jgi:hypothetical protein